MSQISKLNYIDAKLGAATQNGQQTTRILYDTSFTALAAGGQMPKFYEFFTNGANKSPNLTNLSTGKLDSGEAMVIKQIEFQTYSTASGAVRMDFLGLVNVFVGNQCVVKDFNIGTQWGSDYGMMERVGANIDFAGNIAAIRLLTDVVLPPQVDLKITLQYPGNITTAVIGAGDYGFTCKVRGYGVLFNAGTSF